MTVTDHLTTRLQTAGQYELTKQDEELLTKVGLENFIFAKLTSKKFRKWSLSDQVKDQIKAIIADKVAQQAPLVFTFPFGGYKLWRMPSAPSLDWAEFFTIAHTLSFLAPVAAAYEPGVDLIFTSDEIILERMNNVPRANTDLYTRQFRELCTAFSQHLPTNFTLKFVPVRELYTGEEDVFEAELAELISTHTKVFEESSAEEQQHRMTMSELNIQMDGAEPWHKLSPAEQNAKIKRGAILHHAYVGVSRRVEYVKGPGKIIIFTSVIGGIPCIPIGSTKASMTKFWTGAGVLEQKGDSYREIILPPSKLDVLETAQTENVRKMPLNELASVAVI